MHKNNYIVSNVYFCRYFMYAGEFWNYVLSIRHAKIIENKLKELQHIYWLAWEFLNNEKCTE